VSLALSLTHTTVAATPSKKHTVRARVRESEGERKSEREKE